MIRKTITVNGRTRYFKIGNETKFGLLVVAPGVMPFDVRSEAEARTLLRAAYSR